jgi:transposase
VGLLAATAAVATMGQARTFRSGRQFAAYLGLVPSTWLGGLMLRRPRNVASVALANKMARQIWAILAHDRTYEPNYGSSPQLVAAATPA